MTSVCICARVPRLLFRRLTPNRPLRFCTIKACECSGKAAPLKRPPRTLRLRRKKNRRTPRIKSRWGAPTRAGPRRFPAPRFFRIHWRGSRLIFRKNKKEWEAGRAEWEKYNKENPQVYPFQKYEDSKPVPLPPFVFFTKDDKAPLGLTSGEMAERLSALSRQAQSAWEQGIALAQTPDEKAEALFTQAWGLHVLFWSLFVFNEKGQINDGPPAGRGENEQDAAPAALAGVPKPQQSLKAAEEASRLAPNNARYAQAVGDFWALSDKTKAFAAYEKALTLAPKDRNLLFLLYQKTATEAWGKWEKPLYDAYQKSETATPNDVLFATPLNYLHRAASRDRANAWFLYEEASLLFRLAPYAMMGGSARRDATPEQKQAAIRSVLNAAARKRGKRAVDLIVQANGLTRLSVPYYEPSVPILLAQAWKLSFATSPMLMTNETFDSLARLRELVRAVGGYTHVMAENENNLSEGLRASRAAIAMGQHLIGNAPLQKNARDEITTMVGRMIVLVGHKNLIKTYQALNDEDGAEAVQKALDAFQKADAAYRRARALVNDTISDY